MFSNQFRRAASVCAIGLLLAGCGGGGSGGSGAITIQLFSLSPATSLDLNGGEVVEVNGARFEQVQILLVTFSDRPSTSTPVVLDDGTIRVTAPPAPLGQPGPVTVEVTYLTDDAQRKAGLVGAYTYVAPNLPPSPQSMTNTNFTPSGAESFFIVGTNLGPPNGTQRIRFDGIGFVTGTVSPDATQIAANAPITLGAPPSSLVDVFIAPIGESEIKVPARADYSAWMQPMPLPLPNQAAGNASRPVRLSDTVAVLCTSGGNATWGDGDDDVVLIFGPNPSGVTSIRPGGISVGFLDAKNSIPAVLDGDTLAVYSVGPDGFVGTPDDNIVLITQATSPTPTVTPFGLGPLAAAPVVAISATSVAVPTAGSDTVFGNADDDLRILNVSGSTFTPGPAPVVGPVDQSGGYGSASIPFSPDGTNVFILSVGLNGIRRDFDDMLVWVNATTGASRAVKAPFLHRTPIVLDSSGPILLAAPAGSGAAPGGVNDQLSVFTFTLAGTTLTRVDHPLNTRLLTGSPRAFARVGTGMIAVATAGLDKIVNSGDERILVFSDPVAGTSSPISLPGNSVLATFGSGELALFSPGLDFLPGGGDDSSLRLDAAATGTTPFNPVVSWPLKLAPFTSGTRVFLVGRGNDGTANTGDEVLIIHQTLAIPAGLSTILLPLATGASAPASTSQHFVPIGPNWGIVQSPGFDKTFRSLDDQLLIAMY